VKAIMNIIRHKISWETSKLLDYQNIILMNFIHDMSNLILGPDLDSPGLAFFSVFLGSSR
jgi:hypothetical protein